MLSRPQNCSQSASAVQERIAAAARASGRSVDSVTLLAVSKGQSAAAIDSAARAGIEHFGENFLQESLPKIAELSGRELTWHFIGRLQANKTRPVAEQFAWVHGVDRLKIAERLSAQRPYHAPPLNVCLQLHVGGEESKGGVRGGGAAGTGARRTRACPSSRCAGSCACLRRRRTPDASATGFARRAMVFDYLNEHGFGLDTLSMGTSVDFEAAILEGADDRSRRARRSSARARPRDAPKSG